jgi:FkbM family methyltransferase
MTKWKKVKYLKIPWQTTNEAADWQFEIILPEPLASWDVFAIWERERVLSMRDNLTKDDILFDVGAEHGWMSVVFSRFCKVFLIEPTPEFWPNIFQTWIKNNDYDPEGCFCGLIGDKSNCKPDNFAWPKEFAGDMIDKNKYLYLDQCSNDTQIITIDDLVARSGVKPTALTIDVEGWELSVLKGAYKLLSENKIKVWVSVHPDLASKIGIGENDVDNYMKSLGYVGKLLAVDHETHMYYQK